MFGIIVAKHLNIGPAQFGTVDNGCVIESVTVYNASRSSERLNYTDICSVTGIE